MISTKFLIFISYLIVISVQWTTGQWLESTITEFRGGLLGGMGGSCLGRDLLEVKKYEDFVEVFEKPVGSNEFFATSSEGVYENCIENVGSFIADIDYEVVVLIYSRGDSNLITLSVIDLVTSEVIVIEIVGGNSVWIPHKIILTRRSSYKVSNLFFHLYGVIFFIIVR